LWERTGRWERIADLLFSREIDSQGRPKGIRLSIWRFNIGAGTAEHGEASDKPGHGNGGRLYLEGGGAAIIGPITRGSEIFD
jgi:hypothetical protein